VDGLIVYALYRWDVQMQKQIEASHKKEADRHEEEKKGSRMEKAAQRNQTKANQKKQHNNTSNNAAFAMKNKIKQPDKNKTQR